MVDVLVVGGGLSGIHAAYQLSQLGLSYLIVEARDRLGGRIVSSHADTSVYNGSKPSFDLGPSWFWPGQPLIAHLINELELSEKIFLQYAQGAGLYQRADHQVFKGVNGISMEGSYRLKGGIGSLIYHMSKALSDESIRLNSRVSQIRTVEENHIETTLVEPQAHSLQVKIHSRFVILAMPPRLVVQDIDFSPALSKKLEQQLLDLPTWMSNQAKVVIQYPQAFWKKLGLSGDVFSDIGPLREIHDASVENHAALCGFIGWKMNNRKDELSLSQAITDQLTALFGDQAQYYDRIIIKDWAQESYSASEKDLQHNTPQHGLGLNDGDRELITNVFCAGAETASNGGRNNGYLEGAIETSFKCIDKIKQAL